MIQKTKDLLLNPWFQLILSVLFVTTSEVFLKRGAVEAPRFQTLHLVSSFDDHRFNPGVLNLEDRITKQVQDDLASRGHKIDMQTAWGNPSAPTVIRFNSDSGVIEAGADPRRGRYAIAW